MVPSTDKLPEGKRERSLSQRRARRCPVQTPQADFVLSPGEQISRKQQKRRTLNTEYFITGRNHCYVFQCCNVITAVFFKTALEVYVETFTSKMTDVYGLLQNHSF